MMKIVVALFTAAAVSIVSPIRAQDAAKPAAKDASPQRKYIAAKLIQCDASVASSAAPLMKQCCRSAGLSVTYALPNASQHCALCVSARSASLSKSMAWARNDAASGSAPVPLVGAGAAAAMSGRAAMRGRKRFFIGVGYQAG